MITVTSYTEDWKDIYANWCGDSHPPFEILPENGYVAIQNGNPILMAWAYLFVGIGIYWVAWVRINPTNNPLLTNQASKVMMDHIHRDVAQYGYNTCYTTSEAGNGLDKMLERQGFQPVHTNVTQYFKTWEA